MAFFNSTVGVLYSHRRHVPDVHCPLKSLNVYNRKQDVNRVYRRIDGDFTLNTKTNMSFA